MTEPIDITLMPKPTKVWFRFYEDESSYGLCLEPPKTGIVAANTIIPGAMNLDELAKHGLTLDSHGDGKGGRVWRVVKAAELKVLASKIPTALEAQWVATQIICDELMIKIFGECDTDE